jgi:hypothetical protein
LEAAHLRGIPKGIDECYQHLAVSTPDTTDDFQGSTLLMKKSLQKPSSPKPRQDVGFESSK